MAKSRSSVWNEIREILDPTAAECRIARDLVRRYRKLRYLPLTSRALLEHSDGTIAEFYALLSDTEQSGTPVRRRKNSGWMVESDFCFINVRATGRGKEYGSFLQASKLLPAIRASAIHLGPFTVYDFGVIYAVRSIRTIAHQVVDAGMVRRGCPAGRQLRAFLTAAHLLGKTVGFDLEPHVTQFAYPVLMHPQCFRWIRTVPGDRHRLAGDLSGDAMMKEDAQAVIVGEVDRLVKRAMRMARLSTIETGDGDSEAMVSRKGECYLSIVHTLIEQGYWTVPSHTWAGRGVPGFRSYNTRKNYPEFEYRAHDGRDHAEAAYGIVTPFKFYGGVPVNRMPDRYDPPTPNRKSLSLYSSIIKHWRDNFGFDFFRYDSVDHIFDSIVDDDPNIPASDRPTPWTLKQVVRASKRNGNPHVGNFAERMGNEIGEYASLGYDVMLGNDMLDQVNREHLEKSFALQDALQELNRGRKTPFSVVYSIDTHDTGNPHLCGEPLITKEGFDGMRLRLFLSRFLGCGAVRRPKYEVMGLNDLSHGLFEANATEANLTWVGNASFSSLYHRIEDVYEAHRLFLGKAALFHKEISDHYAWWAMLAGRQCLLPIISFATHDPGQRVNLILDLSFLTHRRIAVKSLDVGASGRGDVRVAGGQIHLHNVLPESCFLFSLRW